MDKTPRIITKICITYPIVTLIFLIAGLEHVAIWLCRIAPVCGLYLISILYYAERIRWIQEKERWDNLMEVVERIESKLKELGTTR